MSNLRNTYKYLQKQDGLALTSSTMILFVILTMLALMLTRFTVTSNKSSALFVQEIKARNLAQTGLEIGMKVLSDDGDLSSGISGRLNRGEYEVAIDFDYDENGDALPYSHYNLMKASGNIVDVRKKARLIYSTLPEAFCFSFYGNNLGGQTFNEINAQINGDMFFNGDVGSGSGAVTSTGATYTSTGNGGMYLEDPPTFPELDATLYEELLTEASLSQGSGSGSGDYTNYALDFNGSNQFVYLPNHGDINVGCGCQNKTIEMWFKVDNKNITSRKQTLYEQGGTVRGLVIYVFGGYLYVGGWNEAESGWQGSWLSTNSIQNNTWHHVALTLSGGNSITNNALKGYLDGQQFGSSSGSRLWSHPGDVRIAGHRDTKFHTGDWNNSQYYAGLIDEVRLWNSTRSAAQIQAKKDTVLNGNESGLVAYYNFQENSGSVANDTQTQSNNDGSIYNGAAWTSGPELSKMSSLSYTNTTVSLASFTDNKLLVNGDLDISGSTFNGPGYLVVYGDLTILSGSNINGDISIICSGSLTIEDSQIGASINSPVILYSKGDAIYKNSNIYGLAISKGNSIQFDGVNVYGAILNYSSAFTLTGNTDIIGSVVSRYSVNLENDLCSIIKGDIPDLSGLATGLNPFIVPGSYLEF